MKLEELNIYRSAMLMADEVWKIVLRWDYFSKDTIGKQFIRATDSVAANISEGFGRYYYKEQKQFCYYSRGSLSEAGTWLTKAANRDLISDEEFQRFSASIKDLGVRLNNYISSIGMANSEK